MLVGVDLEPVAPPRGAHGRRCRSSLFGLRGSGHALKEKALVAMWFDERAKSAYEQGIRPPIEETGYRPIRIDMEEHAESVIDRILAEIKEASFVVANFTGGRGGVYFEAGFARGLGLDVIWTCRTDGID